MRVAPSIHRKKSRRALPNIEKPFETPLIEASRRSRAKGVCPGLGFTTPPKALERRHREKLSLQSERAVRKLHFVSGKQRKRRAGPAFELAARGFEKRMLSREARIVG